LSKHTNTILGNILSTDKQWRKYEINSCLDADRVIVVIEEAKGRLSELGIPEDKISVVPNYPMLSDFNDLPKLPMHKSKKVFLYAGGLTKHRGLQYVIQAIPEILKKEPSFELVILGDGNYQGTLIKMTIDLKISGSVIFHGKVPYKKVLEELGRCDIALIPHMKSDHTDNTIPHKLFQYMYCGKPVLASNCIPIERIINLSGAGKIYTWNSSQEFAAMAVRMLHDKQNLIQMASRGKESVEKYFHWGIGEKSLVNLYEALS
jgi:glycosyltransferase involved in cell wall biosynthesis